MHLCTGMEPYACQVKICGWAFSGRSSFSVSMLPSWLVSICRPRRGHLWSTNTLSSPFSLRTSPASCFLMVVLGKPLVHIALCHGPRMGALPDASFEQWYDLCYLFNIYKPCTSVQAWNPIVSTRSLCGALLCSLGIRNGTRLSSRVRFNI